LSSISVKKREMRPDHSLEIVTYAGAKEGGKNTTPSHTPLTTQRENRGRGVFNPKDKDTPRTSE
jgi:hypothetical protein